VDEHDRPLRGRRGRRRRAESQAGRELQGHGSGALSRWLLDNDLVDEMNLFIFPVVVGLGRAALPLDRYSARSRPRFDQFERPVPAGVATASM
jgi:dihydrofolate reductase